jgi:hypothetical protein
MKWLISLVLALVMVTPAFAGEDPYIGIVGRDSEHNRFYVSPKYTQFMFNEVAWLGSDAMTWGGYSEKFVSLPEINQPEVCDTIGKFGENNIFDDRGNTNGVVRKQNAGYFEWYVRLPKKPSGEINLVLQCGVLKSNSFAPYHYRAIELCAAETGERYGGLCSRDDVDPGENPIIAEALPTITAKAIPGRYNYQFAPFYLTAFRNPGTYNGFGGDKLVNSASMQVLNALKYPADTRIMLKACMDKTVVAKIPVTGQVNALGETEWDLEYGDLIYVRLDVPRQNTVDIYCHKESLRVMGIGETWY